MEAGELHELVEHVEHAAHERHATIRSVVTVLILVVTVLTALTGLLAALASRHNDDAQRERAIHTVAAQQADEQAYQDFGQYLDLEAASTADYRRYAVEHRLAQSASGSTAASLSAEADAWNQQNGVFQNKFNAIDLNKSDAASAMPEQEAFSDARAADAWVSKEDADIGVAGLFAVCLFLLGLALSVPGRGVKWGFVAIAGTLALVGVARGMVVNLSPVHRVPHKALVAYEAGTLAGYQQDYKLAATDFRRAVDADSGYGEGWLALAQAQSADETDHGLLQAAAASYEKALQHGEKGYLVHNNLGYVYLLLGDDKRAAAEIDTAVALAPREPYILMSEAEVGLATGDIAAADHWRDKAVAVLAGFDSGFRDQFFAQLRNQDRRALEAAKVPTARLDTFFGTLRNIEASLDAFGSPVPRTVDGASLTNLAATYQPDRGRFEVTFDQNGIHTGDITSLRVYSTADESYSPYSSTPRIDVATEPGDFTFTAHTPIDQGEWRIELYLNGNFQTSITVKSPGDT